MANTYSIFKEEGKLIAKRSRDNETLGYVEGTSNKARNALIYEINKYGWREVDEKDSSVTG